MNFPSIRRLVTTLLVGTALPLVAAACSGSNIGTSSPDGGAAAGSVSDRASFVAACDARKGADGGKCQFEGNCNALYSCVDVVFDPAYRDRILECQANWCTGAGKSECLDRVQQLVVDPVALSWAGTCEGRISKVSTDGKNVDDSPCRYGGPLLSLRFRQEFDRCLTLTGKSEAAICVSGLTAVCESTYF
jgi:hypothetical protein